MGSFAAAAGAGALRGAAWLAQHPLTLFILLPVLLGYAALKGTGVQPAALREAEAWLEYGVWWLGLGVLSSIGLGTGMHSGLLFLFPHILKAGARTAGRRRAGRQPLAGWLAGCGDGQPRVAGGAGRR